MRDGCDNLSLIAGLASAPPPVPDRGRMGSVSTDVKSINCIDGKPLAVGQEMSDGLEKKVSRVARDRAFAREFSLVDTMFALEFSWHNEHPCWRACVEASCSARCSIMFEASCSARCSITS